MKSFNTQSDFADFILDAWKNRDAEDGIISLYASEDNYISTLVQFFEYDMKKIHLGYDARVWTSQFILPEKLDTQKLEYDTMYFVIGIYFYKDRDEMIYALRVPKSNNTRNNVKTMFKIIDKGSTIKQAFEIMNL